MATRRRKPQTIRIIFKGAAATRLAARLLVAEHGEKARENIAPGPLLDDINLVLARKKKCKPWCGERCPNIGNPDSPCGHTEESPLRWCTQKCRDAKRPVYR
jgi:hypothetical protein